VLIGLLQVEIGIGHEVKHHDIHANSPSAMIAFMVAMAD